MLPEPGTHIGGCGCWMGRGQRFTFASWKYRPFHAKISRACQALSVSANASRYRSRCSIGVTPRSEEHTSELQSPSNLVCRLLLGKKNDGFLLLPKHNPSLTTKCGSSGPPRRGESFTAISTCKPGTSNTKQTMAYTRFISSVHICL